MTELREVLGGDWRKTVLYLKGADMDERRVRFLADDYAKALMVDSRLINDPFVLRSVFDMIKKRITSAKVGALKVHGNYSIASGDPYLLCQSMFGLEKTGLLRAGEIYNRYWADARADTLVCYRAPMSCANNIRRVHPADGEELRHWYRYMNTCTILNGWDTITMALNGMDFDGDLVMLTDNPVLVRRAKDLPALMCAQRKAEKKVSKEADFVRSNLESFGNEIGQTTNWITSMYEVRSRYPEDSDEYRTLSYRIQCGQLYQQNVIDKAKGIIAKPMPRTWHDRHAVNKIEDGGVRNFYNKIVADKKPYFMRYIYPGLNREYNRYVTNTNTNALREFGKTVSELLDTPIECRTERMNEFISYYYKLLPVGAGNCLVNEICRRFELVFDKLPNTFFSTSTFDPSILKSGVEYSRKVYYDVRRLVDEYNRRLSVICASVRGGDIDVRSAIFQMNAEFESRCAVVCPNKKVLCEIVVDICYERNNTKRFAWEMCGEEIVQNLLDKADGMISYLARCETGDVEYCGELYEVRQVDLYEDWDSFYADSENEMKETKENS